MILGTCFHKIAGGGSFFFQTEYFATDFIFFDGFFDDVFQAQVLDFELINLCSFLKL